MLSSSKLSRALVVAGLCAIGGAGSAVAVTASSDTDPVESLGTAPVVQSEPAEVPADQADAFEILRQPQTEGDAIPDAGSGPFGANLDLARAVDTPAGTVRVVPANGMICLRGEDAAGSTWSCAPPDQAEAGQLVLSSRDADGDLISAVGILPDGSGGVDAVDAAGDGSNVAKKDGVFTVTASDTQAVSFTGPEGQSEAVTLP